MKKIGFTLLTVLFVIASVACQGRNTPTEVLEIKAESFNDSDAKHVNDIPETVRTFTDAEKISTEREMMFAGKMFELQYADTCEYILGDIRADRYKIKNSESEDGRVLLLSDGTPYAILGEPVCVLDINKTDDEETVRAKLVEKFGTFIDFSAYQYCEATASLSVAEQGRFGGYSFVWKNKVGDISLDNFTKIRVSDDGTVSGVWLGTSLLDKYKNVKAENIPKSANSVIQKKIESIYKTDSCRLKNFEIRSSELTTYSGNVYIHYTVGVNYVHCEKGDFSELCELLVRYE